MRNKLLCTLSNNPGPFVTALFGSANAEFLPNQLFTPVELNLRQLMYLNRTDTDYYLKAYLSVLNGFQDISKYFNDIPRTYDITDFRPKGVFCLGADLLASGTGSGLFTDPVPVKLPVSLKFIINYVDAVYLTMQDVEAGTNGFLNYTASGNDPNKVLQIFWTPNFPFTGPVQLNQAWIPNARVDIVTEPSQFPWSLLIQQISGHPALMKYLQNLNLVDEFNNSFNPAEKSAIALMAVALNNPAVYSIIS